MNMDKLREAERNVPTPLELYYHNDIEAYTQSIQAFL